MSRLWTRFKRRHEVRAPNGRYLADILAEIDADTMPPLLYAYWNLDEAGRAEFMVEHRRRQRVSVLAEMASLAGGVS